MKSKVSKWTVAAAMAAATTAASAQIVVPWGAHDPGELGSTLFFGTGSSFPGEVIYTFSLSQNLNNLLASGVSNDGAGLFDMNGTAVRMYKNNGNANFNDDVLVGGFTFDSTSINATFSNLVGGDYYYKVTGNIDGPRGGSYLLSSAILPAPAISPSPCLDASGAAPRVVPWGVHDPGELDDQLFFGTGSSFASRDVYRFSLAAPTSLAAVAVSNDAPTAFDRNCQIVELFSDNGNADFNDDAFIGGFTYDRTSITTTFNNLGVGNYYYRVSGNVDGSLGGSYLFSSAAAQATVPEPSTLALMLGSLMFGGWAARRRKF